MAFFRTRTGSISSPFYTLYPGTLEGMHTGKTGNVYPIDSSKYQCYHIASYVEPSSLSYQVVKLGVG